MRGRDYIELLFTALCAYGYVDYADAVTSHGRHAVFYGRNTHYRLH